MVYIHKMELYTAARINQSYMHQNEYISQMKGDIKKQISELASWKFIIMFNSLLKTCKNTAYYR